MFIFSPHVIHEIFVILDVDRPGVEERDHTVDPALFGDLYGLNVVEARFFDARIRQAPYEHRVSVVIDLFPLESGAHFPHGLTPCIGALGDGLHVETVRFHFVYPITREGPVVADFYAVDFVLVPHLAKPGRDVGIIDAVSRADCEEAAVGPFSIWGLVGVLLLEVCDALFREEILLQNIDNRVSRLAYEERCRGEVGRGREVAPAEGVGVIDVLELKTEIALDGLRN